LAIYLSQILADPKLVFDFERAVVPINVRIVDNVVFIAVLVGVIPLSPGVWQGLWNEIRKASSNVKLVRVFIEFFSIVGFMAGLGGLIWVVFFVNET